MEYYIITILFISLLFISLFYSGKKLRLKIKSIGGKTYTAEKKDKKMGNSFLDWFYYDEGGNDIEDDNLKKLIFSSFGGEDWYGAYEFYTKADTNKTTPTKQKLHG